MGFRCWTIAARGRRPGRESECGTHVRATPMPITFQFASVAPDDALASAIADLCVVVYGRPVDDLDWRLANMPCCSIATAWNGAQLVAFKIGHAHARHRYHSWLGGVHPEHRRQGIAARLAELQHAWAAEQGFAAVETSADQANDAMTRANLRAGFVVCGMKTEPGRVQVLFRKELARRD